MNRNANHLGRRNCSAVSLCLSFAVLALALLSGCGPRGRDHSELAPLDATGAYRIRSGDVLAINVWGEPQLSSQALVREDGRFTMPLINEVPAAGQTLDELSKKVTTQLAQFIPGATVNISIAQTAPVRYYLLGKFNKPGEIRSVGNVTLLQAIASGGGFAPFADEDSITLIRKGAEGDIRYNLSYDRVLSGREPNPQLLDGDTINVD
ncbi:MAG: polysaccharide biosynthesis/export family protein [Deltaproteobacteria bacterium]|nr:polysaccharide biosynthesis/export family protein [Deltaproteobacteria bacterium]